MQLNPDQKDLLRKTIQTLDESQAQIAETIGLKPSALSDSLRSEGKRPIPDLYLEELIRVIIEKLDAKYANEPGASLKAYLDKISDLRSLLFGGQFSSHFPGEVLPPDLQGRVLNSAQLGLADALASGRWHHVFAGPKMGASSLAALADSLGQKAGYDVRHLGSPAAMNPCSSVSELLLFIFDQVTEDKERGEELRSTPDADLIRKMTDRFKLWMNRKASDKNFKKVLIIIDNFDALIGDTMDLNDFFLRAGEIFSFLQARFSGRIALLTFSSPFARAGIQSISKNASNFVYQANCRDIVTFDHALASSLCRSMDIDFETSSIESAVEFATGNTFLTHLFAYLVNRNVPCGEAEIVLKKLYAEQEVDARSLPEFSTIARSVRRHRQDILRAWSIYRRVLNGAKMSDLQIWDSLERLRNRTHDYNDPVYEWARRMGMVNFDGSQGVLRPVFDKIQSDIGA